MSYRCENCNAVHFGSQLKIVKEIRNVNYNNHYLKGSVPNSNRTPTYLDTTSGTEIVKEEKYCEKCYDNLKDREPKIRDKVAEIDVIVERSKKVVDNKAASDYDYFEMIGESFQ